MFPTTPTKRRVENYARVQSAMSSNVFIQIATAETSLSLSQLCFSLLRSNRVSKKRAKWIFPAPHPPRCFSFLRSECRKQPQRSLFLLLYSFTVRGINSEYSSHLSNRFSFPFLLERKQTIQTGHSSPRASRVGRERGKNIRLDRSQSPQR